MKVSVSFLKSKYDLNETIDRLNRSNADYIHVDYMDGIFIPYKSFSLEDMNNLSKFSKPLDIHIMVKKPKDYILFFKKYHPEFITFHYEAVDNHQEIIKLIKDNNIKVGLAINPNTSVSKIKDLIPLVDLILIMSVNPGLGGQKFITDVIPKINEIRSIKNDIVINIDGGINEETVKLVNTDMVVSGSFVCMSDNFDEQINKLK